VPAAPPDVVVHPETVAVARRKGKKAPRKPVFIRWDRLSS
jgi:hypothetical protein